MSETFVTIVGTAAACCSTFGLLPQALRVWRTKEVEQLSIGTFGLMLAGAVLWLLYGIFRLDYIIIGANFIALLFISYITVIKIMAMRREVQNPDEISGILPTQEIHHS